MTGVLQKLTAIALAWAALSPATAAPPGLQAQVEARLAEMGPGTRFGLVVADADGRELVAILPDQRFIPASNTKLFTVAAALATLPDIDKPDVAGGTAVHLDGRDVTLVGYGDARLSSASDCVTDCLATLADAVAAKTKRVRYITGDATLWPDRRWSWGMSGNNVAEQSGTGIAALSLDNNQVPLVWTREGGAKLPNSYFTVVDRTIPAMPGEGTSLDVERLPFERVVQLTGRIGATGAPAVTIRLGIDDPAQYTAWIFADMLRARGVRVSGAIRSRYTPVAMAVKRAAPLARLVPPPLVEDLAVVNKVSQNQHAELLLRRTGQAAGGDGSVDSGVAVVKAMLARAGVSRAGYDFSDGSGMSTYNRVSPRAMIAFLRWTATQPWGGKFRTTLPIGGVDGTISKRFIGTPLSGKVFAKTGGLNATNALSGWMTAASGRELTFAVFANDVPEGQRAIPAIDAALNLIAAAN